MPLTLDQLARIIDEFAPFNLACDWDNVGLQAGDPARKIDAFLIALEINSKSIECARSNGCGAIVTHHPLIFKPLRALREDDAAGNHLCNLVRNNIGLIVAHTNLDRVLHGTNGALAERLDMRNVTLLFPESAPGASMFKFTVFVPRGHTQKIVDAIHRGGGARIGNYSRCSFRTPGTGTFMPGEGAKPFKGQPGRLEEAEEDRVEAVVTHAALKTVIGEMLKTHPYETPVYDVYPLLDTREECGLGVIGELPRKTTLRALTAQLRAACHAPLACFAGAPGAPVRRAAIITGSAGQAARDIKTGEADALITGELSYHIAQEVSERGLPVITIGHAASERLFADYLSRALMRNDSIKKSNVRILIYDYFPDPFVLP
ncbi:MAG: Nif3-like dinuclear metal center hexameric protein [bacterium]